MNIRFYIILNLFIGLHLFSMAQKVTKVEIKQMGDKITIFYNLEGKGAVSYTADLVYSTDGGKSWSLPVKQLSGDRYNLRIPGYYMMIWDVPAEKVNIEGELQTQVIIHKSLTDTKYLKPTHQQLKSIKSKKNAWLVSTAVFAGTGMITFNRANALYKEYQGTGLKQTRNTVEILDIMSPVAYSLSGLCAVGWMIQILKQNKLEKQLSINIVPLQQGGGMMLTYNF